MSLKVERSTYELKKLSDLWFDLGKINLGAFVIKLLEPGKEFGLATVLVIVFGLTLFVFCSNIGLQFARKVEE